MRKKPKQISQYTHTDEERANNPPIGLVTPENDPDAERKVWGYDPHLDPQLDWAGKSERSSFEVPTVSLHVHERIDPKTILEAVRKERTTDHMGSLFEESRPFREAIEFYKHRDGWSNRLIAGDSLLVMNSLLQKENMADKVQLVYFDPPYGIKYGSNFQPFVNKRSATDGKDGDLSTEPEMIKAFRDTWELGIHSYLAYLRDRLLLAHELLHPSGSIFVQIGDENVHRVSMALDEIFGAENRLATITFATTSGSSTAHLPQVADYLLWYAKDRKQVKYRQLYEKLTRAEIIDFFSSYVGIEEANGKCRKPTAEERFDPEHHLQKGDRIYGRISLESQGVSPTGRSEPFKWNGKSYDCGKNRHWSISHDGLSRLGELGRLETMERQGALRWKKYENEVPGRRISNVWPAQMYPSDKRYVVETATRAVQRCLLMATDPGDLVLDITCGSGTTAYVAEQWGRRWITCDTSRIALALAKHRLMTAHFDYYQLRRPDEGIGSGFVCHTVDTVSPKTLAEDAPPTIVELYDQPLEEFGCSRVTGPFTVEAVPAPYSERVASLSERNDDSPADDTGSALALPDVSIARSGETLRQSEWRDELLKSGIRGKGGQKIMFSRVEPLSHHHLHADAATRPNEQEAEGAEEDKFESIRAVISFGPEHSPLGPKQVELALQEAQKLRPSPELIIFAAFQFDPEAAKDIDETDWPGIALLKVNMNADLQTDDLKRKTGSESFWMVGQPDVKLEHIRRGENTGKWLASVRGFDYFNVETGQIESGGEDKIVAWMLDTDYDGRSLYPSQVFFPMPGQKNDWSKLAKNLRAEIDEDLISIYTGTVSLPFDLGERQRIAVKIVDDRGTESLKVVEQFKGVRIPSADDSGTK